MKNYFLFVKRNIEKDSKSSQKIITLIVLFILFAFLLRRTLYLLLFTYFAIFPCCYLAVHLIRFSKKN